MGMRLMEETADFVSVFIPYEEKDLYGVAAYQFMKDHGLRVLAFQDDEHVERKSFFRKTHVYGQLVLCEKLPGYAGLPE